METFSYTTSQVGRLQGKTVSYWMQLSAMHWESGAGEAPCIQDAEGQRRSHLQFRNVQRRDLEP